MVRPVLARNGVINIGKQGEQNSTVVQFPIVKKWSDQYGEGVYMLLHKRFNDTASYPCAITVDDENVNWVVQLADTANAGSGSCELTYTVDDVVVKSQTWVAYVEESMTDPEEVPEAIDGYFRQADKKIQDAIEFMESFVPGGIFDEKVKKKDYVYEMWYSNLDYDYARNYFKERGDFPAAACSSVRNGNIVGRNLDWFYNHQAEFVVHTARIADRNASLGVAGGISEFTGEFVDSGKATLLYKAIPFQMYDGVNEYGVYANINVVPTDKGINVAEPSETMYTELSATMLVRFVLDYFKTAQEAVDYIRKYTRVYFPKKLHDMEYEVHFMVCDLNKSFVVEFEDNHTVVDELDKPIVTNFHLHDVVMNSDGTVYTPETQDAEHNAISTNHITENGSGLERFNLAVSEYDSASTAAGMRALMDDLKYTRAYQSSEDPSDPVWYTEFVGNGRTVITPPSGYASAISEASRMYNERSRDTGLTWQTCHSSVYDLLNKQLHVVFQEDGDEIDFVLADDRLIEVDPTVPNWAKQPNKPSYTAQEVGALPVGTFIPEIDDTLSESNHAADAKTVGDALAEKVDIYEFEDVIKDLDGRVSALETERYVKLTVNMVGPNGEQVTGENVIVLDKFGVEILRVPYNGRPVIIDVLSEKLTTITGTENSVAETGFYSPTPVEGVFNIDTAVEIDYLKMDVIRTYEEIQNAVRLGLADKFFRIGDQIVIKYRYGRTDYDMPLDVVSFNDVELRNGGVKHGMWLQSHFGTIESIQFDEAEKTVAQEDVAQSGWYYYGYVNDSTRPVLLDVTAGQTIDRTGYTAIYKTSVRDETGDIVRYGDGNYIDSAIRQWLNSASDIGAWWLPAHNGDVAPQHLSTYAGFMRGLESDFLAVLGETKQGYAKGSTTGNGETVYLYDKFFLPSVEQEYGVSPSDGEGPYFEYWKNTTGLTSPSNGANNNRRRFALENHSSAQNCRMKTAGTDGSCYAWSCSASDGSLYPTIANTRCRCTPVCVIC